MDKKIKFLFIGLVGLLVASLAFLFSIMGSRQALIRNFESEEENLRRENEALSKKTGTAVSEKRVIEERLEALQKDFDKITQDKQDLEKKYELVNKERNDLINKLKQRRPTIVERKAPVVEEDTYWAGVLKEKTALGIQVSNLKQQLDNLKINVGELKRDKATLELEVSNLDGDKRDLENRIIYAEKVTDSLSSELVREKTSKRVLRDELKALKREHILVLRQIRTLNNQRAYLENKLKGAEQAKSELQERIVHMNEMLEYKLSQVMDVKEDLEKLQKGVEVTATGRGSIELPPIIVRSGPEEKVIPSLGVTGSVLAINKENNFIIVDLGEENGIKPGVNFSVYRNDERLATVEVIQARKNVSACDIKQSFAPIKVGDQIK